MRTYHFLRCLHSPGDRCLGIGMESLFISAKCTDSFSVRYLVSEIHELGSVRPWRLYEGGQWSRGHVKVSNTVRIGPSVLSHVIFNFFFRFVFVDCLTVPRLPSPLILGSSMICWPWGKKNRIRVRDYSGSPKIPDLFTNFDACDKACRIISY